MSIALVKLCGSGWVGTRSLTKTSATPDGPIPITAAGNAVLPPVQLFRIRKRTVGAGVVITLLELLVPVDPPSGNAGLVKVVWRSLNLKL